LNVIKNYSISKERWVNLAVQALILYKNHKIISLMEKRRLGNTGINVAPLALGTNVFGWTIDEKQSFKILDCFVASGLNLLDTADVYSRWAPGNKGGESETIIGNWLTKSGKRDKVILATKVGSDMGDGNKGLSKAYIVKAVEASLKRLQTDHIDLYQSHFDDGITPVAETMEAYFELMKAGKIIASGASNMAPERLKKSLESSRENGYPAYQALQPLYNLYDRETYERDYAPICKENGLGVICYYSLASGFLTGKYRSENDLSKSVRGQGVKKYMDEKGMGILKYLDEKARERHVTPAAIALAWLMAQPTVTAPIASATTTQQLEELIKATEIKLD
jgi:aryl-alcohol dehydrogenase-like predicted oxidoreductase